MGVKLEPCGRKMGKWDKFQDITPKLQQVYDQHKPAIESKIRETFPQVRKGFQLEPVKGSMVDACAVLYRFKVRISDNDECAEVRFSVGGFPAPNSKPEPPTIAIESELVSVDDD
ncbi:unnamed protein product [Didymodactylos carnosus]|uniref:Uncharacterized protein n=1 Tax=Didymodactylos carnosus TaxID=1234261 RepID=A0A815M3K7_9BILA|nr:unnamed protein product [Didymodactylos carnosus]CAF1411250.1 unnamed protein product [Didymodactylos carnosus]CAF3829631.1 unnamed protein product [Didymodactylos carnosus]CAF4299703.1 unnamed protein product [Didymodactylos carnosus]